MKYPHHSKDAGTHIRILVKLSVIVHVMCKMCRHKTRVMTTVIAGREMLSFHCRHLMFYMMTIVNHTIYT